MAKKQTKKPNKSQKAKQVQQTKKPIAKQINEKRTLTKNEILFFRIGVSVVAIGLVVAAIVMIVNYYMNDNEVNPYEDYLHFETAELVAMTQKINETTYGDLDYFVGKSKYEDFRVILNDHEVFYFYFYHSNDIEDSIKTEIETIDNIDQSPLIFINLSDPGNLALFEDAKLSHLSLDANADEMLLIYDMQPDTTDEFFEVITDVEDIISELGNL